MDSYYTINKIITSYGFFELAKTGKLTVEQIIDYINNGGDVNYKDQYSWSALIASCHGGHLDVVKYLVQSGANVNDCDNMGKTCLMFSLYNDSELKVFKYLVQNGANIYAENDDGQTIIKYVNLFNKLINVIKCLISCEIDIFNEHKFGQKVLILAHNIKFVDVEYYLLNQPYCSNKIIKSKRKNLNFNQLLKKL